MERREVLENELVEYVRQLSLEEHRSNPKYTFSAISIPVTTQHNSGVTFDDTKKIRYTNKCCFIAIEHGMKALGINRMRNVINGRISRITAFELMKAVNFLEKDTQIDTFNPKHQDKLELLTKCFDGIQLQFFVGTKIKDTWRAPVDPSAVFGKGNLIIRILNKPGHFEFITTDQDAFLRHETVKLDDAMVAYQFSLLND